MNNHSHDNLNAVWQSFYGRFMGKCVIVKKKHAPARPFLKSFAGGHLWIRRRMLS